MTAHDRAGERPDAIPGCPEHPGPPIPQAAVEAMVRAATGPAWFDDGHTDCYYRGLIAAALPFLGAAHPEAGSEEAEWLRTELERARARDANLHKRVRERLGQIHGKGYSIVEAVSDLERLATHPVWEQAEQATVDLERAEAEAERLDERARINARYAGKLSAERDEARAEADRLIQTQRELITERNAARTEVERLRDAARAFVRETGATHPAIARIPADAPAAVRYDETRAALLALLDVHPEADRAPESRNETRERTKSCAYCSRPVLASADAVPFPELTLGADGTPDLVQPEADRAPEEACRRCGSPTKRSECPGSAWWGAPCDMRTPWYPRGKADRVPGPASSGWATRSGDPNDEGESVGRPEADRAPEDCAVCGGTGGGAAGMCPACGGTGHEADRAPDHDPACVLPHGHSGLCQADRPRCFALHPTDEGARCLLREGHSGPHLAQGETWLGHA